MTCVNYINKWKFVISNFFVSFLFYFMFGCSFLDTTFILNSTPLWVYFCPKHALHLPSTRSSSAKLPNSLFSPLHVIYFLKQHNGHAPDFALTPMGMGRSQRFIPYLLCDQENPMKTCQPKHRKRNFSL